MDYNFIHRVATESEILVEGIENGSLKPTDRILKLDRAFTKMFTPYNYGFLKEGEPVKYSDYEKDSDFWNDFFKYNIFKSVEDSKRIKHVVCTEVVEIIADYFDRNKTPYKKWLMLSSSGEPHCVITAEIDGFIVKFDFTPRGRDSWKPFRTKVFANENDFIKVRVERGKKTYCYNGYDPTGVKPSDFVKDISKKFSPASLNETSKISIEDFANMFLTESAIHSHLNNTVLDKAREIMEKMNDIEYGSVYSNGKVSIQDNNDWYDDSNKFCPQPVTSILKTKVGHCIDQSELERYYFRKAGIKHKVFSMFPERGTNMYHNHTFLVFFDENDTPYWFDHAWYSEKGIHKGESLEALFKKICDKKRKADPKNDPERAEKFKNLKYEIFEVPAKEGLCWDDYIEWVWKQKLIYKG